MKVVCVKNIKLTFILIIVTGLLACAKSTQDTAKDKQNVLSLAGNWNYSCSENSGLGNFRSQKEIYHFGDDGTFQRKFLFYSDALCQSPSYVKVEDGTIKFTANDSIRDGVAVDFSFSKVSIIPDNKSAANALNAINYCGSKNYILGEAVDVTANSASALCVGVKHTPRLSYDMMKLNDDNHLTINNNANEEDPSRRLQISNTQSPLVRQ